MLESAAIKNQRNALAINHHGRVAVGGSLDFHHLPGLADVADLQFGRRWCGCAALSDAPKEGGLTAAVIRARATTPRPSAIAH